MKIKPISDRNIYGSLIEATDISDHRDIAIPKEHNTISALIFDSNNTKKISKKI